MNKQEKRLKQWGKIKGKEAFITKLIIFGIISPVYGILMGYIGWRSFEKKYE
jgi:hypothetical protein